MVETGIVTFKNVSILCGVGQGLWGVAALLFPNEAFRFLFPGVSATSLTPFALDVIRGVGTFNVMLAANHYNVANSDRETKKRLSWTGLFNALLGTGLLIYLTSTTNRWGGSSVNHYRPFFVNALLIAAFGSLALSD